RVVRPDVIGALKAWGLAPEQAGRGLNYTPRARDDDHDYFFVNHGANDFNGCLQLATRAESALVMDPLSGRTGLAALRADEGGQARVYLQLASGESLLLRTYR